MKDIINNDINVGDKVAFLPRKENHRFQYNLHYGMVTKLTENKTAAYCKSISEKDYPELLRYSHQIIKLS